uniref:F-box domain-containing protein n=1 Tax=Attheya septentrionalis TaxID=420275 RepID=A0A7S2UP45_9STRA|mmetsp:Transcript_6549/g.11728  ORF Transcript_6549/g.11728 Transcript_6549/m.11728 type:complete len:944 (+) Transcript_6549:249-3080(+)
MLLGTSDRLIDSNSVYRLVENDLNDDILSSRNDVFLSSISRPVLDESNIIETTEKDLKATTDHSQTDDSTKESEGNSPERLSSLPEPDLIEEEEDTNDWNVDSSSSQENRDWMGPRDGSWTGEDAEVAVNDLVADESVSIMEESHWMERIAAIDIVVGMPPLKQPSETESSSGVDTHAELSDILFHQSETTLTTDNTTAIESIPDISELRISEDIRPYKSCLKKGKQRGFGEKHQMTVRLDRRSIMGTERRVRGLWNPNCDCPFSNLHNSIISDFMGWLTMEDMVKVAKVCRRWNFCSSSLWKNVDATDFVSQSFNTLHQQCGNEKPRGNTSVEQEVSNVGEMVSKKTGSLLVHHLTRHKQTISKLAIRSIGHHLLPDLAIMGVGACLAAGTLRELTLTSYADLTDTHVNLMLLSKRFDNGSHGGTTSLKAARQSDRIGARNNMHRIIGGGHGSTGGGCCNLTILRLEQCPLLTDRTVHFVATHCPDLTELSLRGNMGITDKGMMHLCRLFKVSRWSLSSKYNESNRSSNESSTSFTTPGSTSELRSLFSPPSMNQSFPSPTMFHSAPTSPIKSLAATPAASALAGLFAQSPSNITLPIKDAATPPTIPASGFGLSLFDSSTATDNSSPGGVLRDTTTKPGSILGSNLFNPPRRSPKKSAAGGLTVDSFSFRTALTARKQVDQKNLVSLNLSRTSVTPKGILNAISSVGRLVHIQKLIFAGSGELWTDEHLEELANLIHLPELTHLDISCAKLHVGTKGVTDSGLQDLTMHVTLGMLTHVNLSGHLSISGHGVADLIQSAPNLEDLNLGGCRGLMLGTRASDSVTKSPSGITPLKDNPGNALVMALGDSHTLHRLVLWRCFMNGIEARRNPEAFAIESDVGKLLVRTLCGMRSMEDLDLDSCYFVNTSEVEDLRKCIRDERRLQLEGTLYRLKQEESNTYTQY